MARPERLREIASEVRGCTACSLSKTGYKLPGMGDVESGVMVIGLAPSKYSCRAGRHYHTAKGLSASGALLESLLVRHMGRGLEGVYVTDLVKCPFRRGERHPARTDLSKCLQHLYRELELVRPRVIVALGVEASRFFSGGFTSMRRGHGSILRRLDGSVVLTTYHPTYAVRRRKRREMDEDLGRLASLHKLRSP